MDQDHPDRHMEEREAEKTATLESLADALAAFRNRTRDLDRWERVHIAQGLAAVAVGCYGIGAVEAALALTPEIERSPSAPSMKYGPSRRVGIRILGPLRSHDGTDRA